MDFHAYNWATLINEISSKRLFLQSQKCLYSGMDIEIGIVTSSADDCFIKLIIVGQAFGFYEIETGLLC